ncbi:50S ribosomal protein L25 [candidate division TA06 bacterium]|uniref:Large ribosomal subunit protein bL25 n=1 Tax=candidate division TA06 bacterium TaxID=2250710 RepID=A0A523UTF9_UNCT6|nr:MAG: 50S ribosomal protein L25 [candidate division TA06 bacterium]
MAERDLNATVREEKGKQAGKKLRKKGYVPGVMYGHGESAIPLAIESKALSQILEKSSGDNIIFNVKIEGREDAKAVLKEIQRDPVSREIMHVDFQHVHAGEVLTVQVPIILTGSSPGVKEGGILEHILRKVEVRCLPSQLPDHLVIDISQLGLGDLLHVKDLATGALKILDDSEMPVVSILVPKAKVEVPVAAEEVPEEEAAAEEEKEEEKAEEEKEKKEGREKS